MAPQRFPDDDVRERQEGRQLKLQLDQHLVPGLKHRAALSGKRQRSGALDPFHAAKASDGPIEAQHRNHHKQHQRGFPALKQDV